MPADPTPSGPLPIVLWTDASAAARDGQIIDRLSGIIRVVGVGGPRTGEVAALARRLSCRHDDDFRNLMIQSDAHWLLVGSMQDIDLHDITAVARDVKVAAIEPVIDSLDEPSPPADRVFHLPAMLRCPGWLSADQPPEFFAETRSMRFTSFGRPDHASLFARLLDAWRTVTALAGLPESIDAALTGPLTTAPEDPRGLTGCLAGLARFDRGRSLIFEVSDRAGSHERALHVRTRESVLIVTDDTYELADADGEPLDRSRVSRGPTRPPDFVDQVVHDWQGLISPSAKPAQGRGKRDAEIDSQALACALASSLSARTTQPESPAKLLALPRKSNP